MKLLLTYLGGLIAFINLVWFAVRIWNCRVPSSTPASFMMWSIIDAILFASSIVAHQPPWLALGYMLGALSVTIAQFARSSWKWTWRETICAVGAGVTTFAWFKWNADAAVFWGVMAMTVAGIPIWLDMWKQPVRESWPVWFYTIIACIVTLLGSDWTLTGCALAVSGIVFNGSPTLIVLFKKAHDW